MRIGVIFPQTEIGADPSAVRDYAQAAEALGFSHLAAYDHVLGADPSARPPGWRAPYTHLSSFHEPLVLFGYLAGLTTQIELVSSIIILPQRQTVLVAKQAAEVDVLSNGRLRLGVAIGWNAVEYQALNESFETRGRRIGEQIEVLRALWTQEVVSFEGRWHHIEAAGIRPLPVQRPIPVWMGGMSDSVLRRAGRIADGWFPQLRPADPSAREVIARIRGYAEAAGRDPNALGIEGRVNLGNATPDQLVDAVRTWRELGATHLSLNTMGSGLATAGDRIDAIRRFSETIKALREPD